MYNVQRVLSHVTLVCEPKKHFQRRLYVCSEECQYKVRYVVLQPFNSINGNWSTVLLPAAPRNGLKED